MNKKTSILLFISTLFFFQCERAEEPTPDPDPDPDPFLSAIQTEIFDLNCALSGCHSGGTPPKGLNLENGQSFTNLVNVASDEQPGVLRVKPNAPNESYLYLKIIGDASITGSQMPLGRSALSADQMEQIRTWIEAGALNN